MNRRTFCTAVGTAITGGTVLSGLGTAAETTDEDEQLDGLVSARGHFIEDGTDVRLSEGHTELGYDTYGEIPGFEGGDSPEDILVGIHGVIDTSERSAVEDEFRETGKRLADSGYEGPFIGFTYDSANDFGEALGDAWSSGNEQRTINRRSAHKLAAFLQEYRSRCPETAIHLAGHSGGGFVELEVVKRLHEIEWDGTIETALLLGAGVNDETVAVDGRYGPSIKAIVNDAYSLYSPDDWVMDIGYSLLSFDTALGAHDVQGTPPENLTTIKVDQVDSHGDYFLPGEDGAGKTIVEKIYSE